MRIMRQGNVVAILRKREAQMLVCVKPNVGATNRRAAVTRSAGIFLSGNVNQLMYLLGTYEDSQTFASLA
jgi:hypothetical protein